MRSALILGLAACLAVAGAAEARGARHTGQGGGHRGGRAADSLGEMKAPDLDAGLAGGRKSADPFAMTAPSTGVALRTDGAVGGGPGVSTLGGVRRGGPRRPY